MLLLLVIFFFFLFFFLFRIAQKARAFLPHAPHKTPQNRYETCLTGQLLAYDHVGEASIESGKGTQLTG